MDIDILYALKQLRDIDWANPRTAQDRVARAIDALERVEEQLRQQDEDNSRHW